MNYRTLQPSPYAQSNRQGQVSDPVSKLLDLLKPVVNHVTKPQPQQPQGFDPNNYVQDYQNQSNAANAAYGTANQAYAQSAGAYRNALTAPRPAMPQQTPALGQKEAGWAAGLGGLAMLLGARPQFVQQGIQGYTGTRENQAQMGYANQVNDYNAKNDQNDRNLQGLQLDLSNADHQRELARIAMERTGGNLDAAKQFLTNYHLKSQEDATKAKETKSRAVITSLLGAPPKNIFEAKGNIKLAVDQGIELNPEFQQNYIASGKQTSFQSAIKRPIKTTADAAAAAMSAGFDPTDPEYDSIMQIGKAAETMFAKYHMTNEEKKQYFDYQQKVLQSGRIDLLDNRQAFDAWKLGQQQAGMNTRQDKSIAAGKVGREFTQGEITKRSREGDQRKMLKPYNDALNKMIPGGFAPLQPVLPGNLPKNGTSAVKPAQTKPQTQAKPVAKAATPSPKPKKAVITNEKGKKVTTFKY